MNEREPKFIGRQYTEEETIRTKEEMRRWRQRGAECLEGEQEKTEFDLKVIALAQELLVKYLKSGGFEPRILELGQIHFLDGRSFYHIFLHSKQGIYKAGKDAVYINREKVNTAVEYFVVLLHELVHAYSSQKFYVDKEQKVYDARLGYGLRSIWKKNKMPNAFWGLNEFMTEMIVYVIMSRNAERLEKELNISSEKVEDGSTYAYMRYGKIINGVIDKIVAHQKEPRAKIIGRLHRGLFENTILKLKDVEKVFGKGSLRILASLGSWEDKDKNEQNRKLVEEFFTTENKDRREKLRKEILSLIS